jgi:hypothetical protein
MDELIDNYIGLAGRGEFLIPFGHGTVKLFGSVLGRLPDPGVIDRNIEPTKFGPRGADSSDNRGGVRDIALKRKGSTAGLGVLDVHIKGGDLRTVRRQPFHNCAANATPGTCDNGSLAIKTAHQSFAPVIWRAAI